MMHPPTIVTACVLAALTLISPSANAMAGSHPEGDLPNQEQWPVGLVSVVNMPERVSGYWVNATDIFFYKGDTEALNACLATCTELSNTTVVVVMHQDEGVITRIGDTPANAPQFADWSLTHAPQGWHERDDIQTPHFIQIDLYTGGSIDADAVEIPQGVIVEEADVE